MFGYEKTAFLNLPTPLDYLPSLSEKLGVEFYMKRDDLTNLGTGGNKLRKLEYLLKDALSKNATMLLTEGGAQTNHGRLTAAVAAKYGLKCVIVSDDPYPGEISANILLDRIMGAEVVLHADGKGKRDAAVKMLIEKYTAQGENVYYIPTGGSNSLGALGYYECAKELLSQTSDGHVITTVGSMGTYMGLFCGLQSSHLKLTGVLIGPFFEDTRSHALKYFNEIKRDWNLDYDVCKEDFHILEQYTRGGYNNPVKEVREAIYEMGRTEGIILDPCYTGKTYAALKEMIASGYIQKGEKVIFVHTGGTAGINTPVHRWEMEKELMDGITIIK